MRKTLHTTYRDEALRKAEEAFLTESKVFRTSEVDLGDAERGVLLTELRRQEDSYISQAAEHEYRNWVEEEEEEEVHVLTVDELLDPFEAFKIVADLLVANAQIPDHDCHAGPEDGCDCDAQRDDCIPGWAEEEEEEEDEVIRTIEAGEEDTLVPSHIDGLGGEESALAVETMLHEIYYGQEDPIIL